MKKVSFLVWFLMLSLVALSFAATEGRRVEKKIIVTSAKKAALGVLIKDLDKADKAEVKVEHGAKIEEVLEDSEAERIGLKEGDVIVGFAGKDVANARELKDLVSGIGTERTVKIEVMRDGEKKTFSANLKPLDPGDIQVDVDSDSDDFDFRWNSDDHDFTVMPPPAPGRRPFAFFGEVPHHKGGYLGVHAKNISKQMLEYFEVDHGVQIAEVFKDSPADKAGLKAGDVITGINNRKVEDFEDLVRIINYYNPGEKVRVNFSRKGSKKSVEVVLGEKKERQPKMMKFKGLEKMNEGNLREMKENAEKAARRVKIFRRRKLPELKKELRELKDIDIELYII